MCLCTTHHARLHEGHLRIEGDADGELLFHDATGAALPSFGASHGGTANWATIASQGGTATGASTASHSGTANGVNTASHSGTASGANTASRGGTGAGAIASPGGRAGAMGAGEEAATLLALMGKRGGWSVDALVEASGLRTGVVQSALVLLELDGRVAWDGFGSYVPRTSPEPRPL